MRKVALILGLIFTVAALRVAVAADAPAAPKRSITQVAGDIYRFQDGGHCGVFMVTAQGVILVDPITLDTARWVQGEIASRFHGAKVVQVLYSHHHYDHVSGAAAFPGATILSRIESGPSLRAIVDPKERELYRDVAMPTEFYSTPVHRITLGGKTVELHYFPSSHAKDVSFIYFPAEKVLFGADVIGIKRLLWINMPRYDEPDQMRALDAAMAFDAAIVVPGHGPAGTKQDLEDFRQYIFDLHRGVQAGIDKGQTLAQIQAELRLEKYAHWVNYTEWRPLNIEGMYTYLTKKK